MPVYDYECPNCKWKGELFHVVYSERGDQSCPECDEPLCSPAPRFGIIGAEPFQMKAIAYDGERKVGYADGHFGKSAKRRRK